MTPTRRHWISDEIALVEAALARHEDAIDAMDHEWAVNRMPCCPGCAFGLQYTEAVAKATRTARWLAVLLAKRGHDGDAERSRFLHSEWPILGERRTRP